MAGIWCTWWASALSVRENVNLGYRNSGSCALRGWEKGAEHGRYLQMKRHTHPTNEKTEAQMAKIHSFDIYVAQAVGQLDSSLT